MESSPPATTWSHPVETEAETERLATLFAAAIRPPGVLYLRGHLGAGKTTFARALMHALGFPGYVKSPTYGLLETYEIESLRILHLDLYRIEDPEELEFLALRDLYDSRSVLLVEWPERGGRWLPPADLVLEFDESCDGRSVRCTARSAPGRAMASEVREQL